MKRTTPLRRSSPLPRGETPRNRKPMRKVSKRRKGSLFPHRRDRAYCAWIREWPCLIFDHAVGAANPCAGPVECAHVKTQGSGGDDRGNTMPLCRRHHREQHRMGIRSFGTRYGINMASLAQELLAHYEWATPPSAHPGAPTP